MSVWQNYVREKEEALAAESNPLKVSLSARVGLHALMHRSAPDDDLAALLCYVEDAVTNADDFFSVETSPKYQKNDNILTFPSPLALEIEHPNNTVQARIFSARSRRRAVVLLPYWNAPREKTAPFAEFLSRCGITCVQLSMPYHDERTTPGTGFAREMACEDLGLTIHANRQAVVDARVCLDWLESNGYERLGIVGLSIGSSIASIVAALDNRVSAAAFLLMADDFAKVVWTGSATRHVKESLEKRFTLGETERAWSIISPSTYAQRISRNLANILIISGKLDTVFIPELTDHYVDRLRAYGVHPHWIRYGCGHYTLGLLPYAVRAFLQTVIHLRRYL